MIQKKALLQDNFYEPLYFFENARQALKSILNCFQDNHEFTLILPSYIGWSPREGSGIYDPIKESRCKYVFYEFDENLSINIEDLKRKIKNIKGEKALFIVHYFGYVDLMYKHICEFAKKNNCYIIEDSAHAFFTEYVDGKSGAYGDFVLYSLHKMFPFDTGGMLKVKNKMFKFESSDYLFNPFSYNLREIAEIRKRNAIYIENKLLKEKNIILLRPSDKYKFNTPQTVPILLKKGDRFKIYEEMNKMGLGVISLYHTMIDEINDGDFSISRNISSCILNLPVHQDVKTDDLDYLCNTLIKMLEEA